MATTKEYQDRNVVITSAIASLRTEESRLRSLAAAQRTNANEHRKSVGNRSGDNDCHGTKKQKGACEANKIIQLGNAANADALAAQNEAKANNIRDVQIKALQKEFDENLTHIASVQTTSMEVSRTLASKGLTLEGSYQMAILQGEGMKESEIEKGRASALAIETISKSEAEVKLADASNKKKLGLIIAAVGFVIVLGVSIVLYKKFKKKA